MTLFDRAEISEGSMMEREGGRAFRVDETCKIFYKTERGET